MNNLSRFYKKGLLAALVVMLFVPTGCKEEFLEAEPLSFFTPSNALNTPEGLRSLLSEAMTNIRAEFYGDGSPIITENVFSEVAVEGTTDKSGPAQDLNLLILPDANLNSSNTNRIGWYWREWYKGIKFANTVISRLDDATFKNEAEKNAIRGAAYFHRAYRYYRLTHQFGDVPLILNEITTPRLDFVSTARMTILQKIKEDLEQAAQWMPEGANKDKVSKAAVLHLLTKVNLAMGNFDAAIASASQVIDGGQYALMTGRFGVDAADPTHNVTWDLHRPENKSAPDNREAILNVIDRVNFENNGDFGGGTSSMRQAVPLWWRFINTPNGKNGMSDRPNIDLPQVLTLGRGIGRNRGTRYSTEDIWADANNDLRFAKGNWYKMEDIVYNAPSLQDENNEFYGENLQLYLPDGTPLCSDTIRNWYDWPFYKLFIPDPLRVKPQGGHSDWYIFRLAETYLLRAEAHVWNGNLSAAAADINKVRERANADPVSPSDVDIDYILDERVRELYYEEPRKTELTRIAYIFAQTGQAAENGKSYNLENFSTNNYWYDRIQSVTDFYNMNVRTLHGDLYTMSPYHVLWPVPASSINANTQGIINQNEGYPGAENNIEPLRTIPADK